MASRLRVESYCLGIGWVTFAFAKSMASATELARQTKVLDPRRWPGLPLRVVRVVEPKPDGTTEIHHIDPPAYKAPEQVWET